LSIKKFRESACLLMIRHHSFWFKILSKASVWSRSTELNYYCGLFAINDRWRKW
jgi:hypothetical protein